MSARNLIVFIPVLLLFSNTNAILFDRKLTGIEFYPYLREDIQNRSTYTLMNIRTMLEAILTRFSRVLIMGVDTGVGRYERGITYYERAGVRARTPEIAAQINRERNSLSMTVLIGVFDGRWYDENGVTAAFFVALEAAEVANSIYPGTVEGILLGDDMTESGGINETLNILENIRKLTSNLRLGFAQPCGVSSSHALLDTDGVVEFALDESLVRVSDFVLCFGILEGNSSRDSSQQGSHHVFDAIQSLIFQVRFHIKSINSNAEVMWYMLLQKSYNMNNTEEDIDILHNYYANFNKFATNNDISVWFHGAFRNSRKSNAMTWWELTRLEQINNASAYVETIPGLDADIRESSLIENYPVKEDAQNLETRNEPIWTYIGIFIGAITMSLVCGCGYFIHKKCSLSRCPILTKQEIGEFRYGVPESDLGRKTRDEGVASCAGLHLPYDNSLEIPKEKLQILTTDILGGGEFGCVFKALLRDDTGTQNEVALKMAKPNSGATALKGLLSEIKILSYLEQHSNIVQIVGAYTAEIHNGTVYLATELCPRGNLKNRLKTYWDETKQSDLSSIYFTDMARWSWEIACGMEYLADKQVIHADLATRNVLLSSENIAKINDFGLSRRLYEYTNYVKQQQEPLPWRWMALESLKMLEFSTKSDVWSYGVTLWEIFSLGAIPYPGVMWSQEFVEKLEDGLRLIKPRYATSEIFGIMMKCWSLDAAKRPSFKELKSMTRNHQINVIDKSIYTTLSE